LGLTVSYIVLSIFFCACFQEALHDGFMTHARGHNQCSAAILRFRNEAAVKTQRKNSELNRRGEARLLPTRVFKGMGLTASHITLKFLFSARFQEKLHNSFMTFI
jgi:hypothetical protein